MADDHFKENRGNREMSLEKEIKMLRLERYPIEPIDPIALQGLTYLKKLGKTIYTIILIAIDFFIRFLVINSLYHKENQKENQNQNFNSLYRCIGPQSNGNYV
jgi:hypothetical protein